MRLHRKQPPCAVRSVREGSALNADPHSFSVPCARTVHALSASADAATACTVYAEETRGSTLTRTHSMAASMSTSPTAVEGLGVPCEKSYQP